MTDAFKELLVKYDLTKHGSALSDFMLPCVSFDLVEGGETISKLGGNPALPADFEWPVNKNRLLEVVLQVDLSEVAPHDVTRSLPTDGLLTFFYDMEEQPWGFDPKDASGFRVLYTPPSLAVVERQSAESEYKLPEKRLSLRPSLSVPSYGSRAYDKLSQITQFTDAEADRFDGFGIELALVDSGYQRKYWGGKHRFLGYSDNVQGDMQLEVELVSNGLYAGNASGYEDPRALELEANADDWILLLQVDSDEGIDLMWGDVGSVYFWIKKADLASRNFDNVWMILQCS